MYICLSTSAIASGIGRSLFVGGSLVVATSEYTSSMSHGCHAAEQVTTLGRFLVARY